MSLLASSGIVIVIPNIDDSKAIGHASIKILSIRLSVGPWFNENIADPFELFSWEANLYPLVDTAEVSQEQFTAAILRALPLEIDAFSSLFDEFWDKSIDLIRKAPNDFNAYTIGRMHKHMVVLVPARSVCYKPAVNFSKHKAGFGGRNMWWCSLLRRKTRNYHWRCCHKRRDRSKSTSGFSSEEIHAGTLGRPNVAIRSLLQKIKTKLIQERLAKKMANNLQNIHNNLGCDSAQYPEIDQDELFIPTTLISTILRAFAPRVINFRAPLIQCMKTSLIYLGATRIPSSQMIYIALFGSGDRVMKSGLDRDEIATRDKVMAFEMEGARVWDILPCIVIKGVCDYADSHKNEVWQHCADATGAACMRAVLDEWPIGLCGNCSQLLASF
ncbi:conserved hypothetical protein [Talaromyces stipitatus ATCC 10500]|uniref:Nucleoside phosphorylase domain-containing protein n=1 Tax=Talaromyces stipitatus (strain ATCC 10500 / CBS 375.48 / QM 6759 / NRRL 1006) TaxID=441959 RepID=B8LYC8_TALSN|nr:uncharacterized protein TSTA_063380 [Talaromyces stipitatus ATCC 10500]EED22857.1 conserved hypothetical protein [Talaromyces stipitatus ATCC 10500]